MELTEAKKLKGVVTTLMPGPMPAAARRKPQGVRAGRATDGMRHPKMPGRGALEGGNLLAQDELPRFEHVLKGFQQFAMKRLILAPEVQHGHGLGQPGAARRRGRCVLHGCHFSSRAAKTGPGRPGPAAGPQPASTPAISLTLPPDSVIL